MTVITHLLALPLDIAGAFGTAIPVRSGQLCMFESQIDMMQMQSIHTFVIVFRECNPRTHHNLGHPHIALLAGDSSF
jgi:hypothetical protein